MHSKMVMQRNSCHQIYVSATGDCIRISTICICETKGPDQLCSNCTADLGLCFLSTDSIISLLLNSKNFKFLAFFYDCAGQFVFDLVKNTNYYWFSHAKAHVHTSFHSSSFRHIFKASIFPRACERSRVTINFGTGRMSARIFIFSRLISATFFSL